MSTNTTNKRKRITINAKVAITNAVHKQEKSILTLKMISQNQCYLPTIQDTTFFFIPYYGNNDNPCYNDTLRKEQKLSLLPSSTVTSSTFYNFLFSKKHLANKREKGIWWCLNVARRIIIDIAMT